MGKNIEGGKHLEETTLINPISTLHGVVAATGDGMGIGGADALSTTQTSTSTLPFTDVSDTAWYKDAVQYVYEHNMMNGTSGSKFSPDSSTSRGMIVTILHRMEDTPSASGTAFTDVSAGKWYTDAVAWASANNIVNGYSNGKFGPDDSITREQMATILYRYAQHKKFDTTITGNAASFSDGGKVSSYAVDAVNWAIGVGLLQGTGNNKLSPTGGATRAQAATILMRFCENIITSSGEITYKAPKENDIDSGTIEYDGGTYTAEYVNNQLIVVFKDGESNKAEELVAAYSASIVGRIETIGMYQIEFDSAKTMGELNSIISELKANTAVEDAYLNTVVEIEDQTTPFYPPDFWDIPDAGDLNLIWDELLPRDNNWGAEAINAPSAWQLLIDEYGSISDVPSVPVGIIDGYIDMTHEDLERNAKSFYWYRHGFNTLKGERTDETFAKYAADADNWDDYKQIVHGTHVTGTIGARMGNGGINGIAINPKLYGVSIAEGQLNDAYKSTIFGHSTALSNLIEDSNCKVINFSQGYGINLPLLAKYEANKVGRVLKGYLDKDYDFLIVDAAGNDRTWDAQYNSYFAAITDDIVKSHIIVVGNAEMDYLDLSFSLYDDGDGQCYGSRVDVLAPGTYIYSTVSPNERSFSSGQIVNYAANSNYTHLTGTSMAAPHVSGVAALVWAANEDLTGDQVKQIIIETANIPVDGKDAGGYSHNMVNAAYAVSVALREEYTVNGTCGNDMTWNLDTWRLDTDGALTVPGNLTIQGTGEMTWTSRHAPWYRYREVIGQVKVEDGITSLEASALVDMPHLHSITIPSSVQEIGDQALGYNEGNRIGGFIIYGYPGTAAETYAEREGFTFVNLTSDDPTPSPTPDPSPSPSPTPSPTPSTPPGPDPGLVASGDGTEENPYQIKTATQLDAVRNDLSAHYIQVADIDLSGLEWIPIGVGYGEDSVTGSLTTESKPFTGSFDGNGFVIRNLNIETSDFDYVGLFGSCSDSSSIKNIVLENLSVDVDNSLSRYVYVGGIVGRADSQIVNCHVSGNISVLNSSNYANVGGIAGNGTATNSTNKAKISASTDIKDVNISCGGIVGSVTSGSVLKCINYGDVTASGANFTHCGGISGKYGDVSYCVNYGKISGSSTVTGYTTTGLGNINLGGITGAYEGSVTASYCANLGTIDASLYTSYVAHARVGGIFGFAGYYGSGSINHCYNAGSTITCKIFARNYAGTYDESNGGDVGRIIGWGGSSKQISDNYSLGTTLTNEVVPADDLGDTQNNGGTISQADFDFALKSILDEINS